MRFQCPKCREIVAVDNSAAGKTVQCGRCQKVVPVPASRTEQGALIADFIIKGELGRGGMGIVYLSHQISLDRSAALKVLSSTYANNSDFVIGFIKEARAAAKLNHPHIVQAYAVGEDEGLYYFAMENIDGKTMKEVLDKRKIISVDDSVLIIQQIAEALDYAWKEQRLIHRDIKPDNIMLTKNGKAKLADLGLARVAGEKDELENGDEVMGTPQYISPEALLGEPMDVRSDIYSLGATFYQFVTGQFPFNGNSASEIAKKHITDQLVPPIQVNPAVPQAVSDVIVKMMEKDPNRRYQDAELLVEDLRNIRKYKTTTSGKIPRLTIPTTSAPILKMKGSPSVPINKVAATSGILKIPTKTELDINVPVPSETDKENAKDTTKKVTRQVRNMKAERERKAIGKFLALIIGAVLVVGLIGGAIYWFVFGNAKEFLNQTVSKVRQTVTTTVEKAQEPSSTALTMKADEILKFIAEDTSVNPEKALALCEDFFQNFKDPKYTCELEKYAELSKIFDQYDEQLAAPKRKQVHAEYLAKLDAEREAARKRAEDAEREAKERREREQREREQKKIADELKRKEQNELNVLRSRINRERPKAVIGVIDSFAKGDYDSAKKILTDVISIQQEANGKFANYRTEAGAYAGWGRRQLQRLDQANQFRNHLRNGGSELKRPQIVHKNNLGYVTSIKDGVLTADKGGGKTFSVDLRDLSRTQFNAFIVRLANKMNNPQAAMYYHAMRGDFDAAEDFATDNRLKNELSEIATDYLREKYKASNATQKSELVKKYGKLNVFKKATGLR